MESISLREGFRVAVLITVECDVCGYTDPALQGAYRIGPFTFAKKRKQARALGWRCSTAGKGQWTDLCPKCKPARQSKGA